MSGAPKYERISVNGVHNCKPRDGGRTGELRRCTECGKWWRKNPGWYYQWDRVMPWHIKERASIRQHEAKMLTLVEAEREVEDR